MEPEIDDGRIDGKVVPTAWIAETPRRRIAGVETTAPPMPNMPDNMPVTTPIPMVSKNSTATGIAATVLARWCFARNLDSACGYPWAHDERPRPARRMGSPHYPLY